ncbi:NAD-dependent epimerase/dehydratase family protein, partial [Candidatus Poribacteria bacterium]|nr:NAD-dependent epimerase/dehydratase family protein [Candidatus Poribacteria bacterium]
MRTLVTGATGHVGANVVRRLAVSGRRIRILARPTSPLDIVSRYVSDVAMGDLLDRSSLVAAMRGCDVVYHAAAVYSLWRPDASDIFRPTVEGSRNVLEAAAEAGVRRVVYVSSIVTLAARANGRLDESGAPAKPRTPYLRAKVEAEQYAREFAE